MRENSSSEVPDWTFQSSGQVSRPQAPWRLEQQHSKWCDGVNGAFLSMQDGWKIRGSHLATTENGKRPQKPVIQASEAGSSLFRLSVERGGKTAPTWAPGKMGPW